MTDQNTQFMAILTAVGEAKQANANALGIPWIITQMGVGDANGTEPTPNRLQTSLINERRRAPLNQLKVDPDNEAIIIAEQVIPENVGGWWIREIGLYDEDGDLVAVANCPPTFKPELSQGSGRTQVVRLNILVSSTENIQLKIDPSVVLATRGYVDALTVRASQKDAEAGEDNSKVATILRVFQSIRSVAANATETLRGTLRIASAPEAKQLTAGDLAITPVTLGAVLSDVAQNIAVFDAAGTYNWQVPEILKSGKRKAWVAVTGGGGGGAYGGGAGGGTAIGLIDLAGEEFVTVTVGASGERSLTAPTAGGTSSFGTFLSATGGVEGNAAGPTSNGRSTGGVGVGGLFNFRGEDAAGANATPSGGASFWSPGGINAFTTTHVAGVGRYGAGGGGVASSGSPSASGGGQGLVIIKW